jgi:hypothetical protein
MLRRRFIAQTTAIVAAVGLPTHALSGEITKVQSLSQAMLWLDQLEAAPGIKTSGVWPLSAVLEHLSQSIEMSMDGFAEHKSRLFQNTVGTLAFTAFKLRGKMSHSLSDPIPGAPVLTASAAWRPAANRLRAAITRFNAHSAALKPHFAYGNLSKSDAAVAHTLHIANHQDEIAIHRLA